MTSLIEYLVRFQRTGASCQMRGAIMLGFKRLLLSGAVAVTGLLVGGCQADSKPPQSSLVPTTQGITCAKCQTTWVKVPIDGGKGRIVGYTSQKRHVCPDCRDAVSNFFATGKLQHTCKTCGDAMEICESH
jgi:hypothetical protein